MLTPPAGRVRRLRWLLSRTHRVVRTPKTLPLSVREGNLTADGGFTVLNSLGDAVTARRDRCMESALVLGHICARPSSQ